MLLPLYENSPMKLLTSLYPKNDWQEWKFSSLPKGYWSNLQNQLNFLSYLSKQLNIKSMDDWYKITAKVKNKIEFLIFFF